MEKPTLLGLDFALYFEPEAGINTPEEFSSELHRWRSDAEILHSGMEPVIRLEGKTYVCRLGQPNLTARKNPICHFLNMKGVSTPMGSFLGYKWVYLYERSK